MTVTASAQQPAQFVSGDFDFSGVDHLADFFDIVRPVMRTAGMDEFPGFFSGDFPARTTIEVSRLPLDVAVEIDVVAVV